MSRQTGLRTTLVAAFLFALILVLTGPASASPPAKPQGELHVPILMYHYIRVNPIASDLVGADLSVTPLDFLQQMYMLSKGGVTTITFDDLRSALLNGTPLPPHPVILTFDDGYEDFYTNAFPVLSHFNMKATSFIITGKVGWQGYMRWDEIRRIQFTGLVQFESHTVNHLALDTLSSAQVRQELTDSKSRLEAELQQPVKYLAYPMGRFNSTVVSIAKDVGYEAAVTTEPGGLHTVGGLPTLSRVRVPGAVSLWDYALSIWSYR